MLMGFLQPFRSLVEVNQEIISMFVYTSCLGLRPSLEMVIVYWVYWGIGKEYALGLVKKGCDKWCWKAGLIIPVVLLGMASVLGMLTIFGIVTIQRNGYCHKVRLLSDEF